MPLGPHGHDAAAAAFLAQAVAAPGYIVSFYSPIWRLGRRVLTSPILHLIYEIGFGCSLWINPLSLLQAVAIRAQNRRCSLSPLGWAYCRIEFPGHSKRAMSPPPPPTSLPVGIVPSGTTWILSGHSRAMERTSGFVWG